MSNRQRPQADLHDIARCARCGRRPTKAERKQPVWNIELRDGMVIGFLCPACQTPDENAEAEINWATLDYGRAEFDEQGRWGVPPKAD